MTVCLLQHVVHFVNELGLNWSPGTGMISQKGPNLHQHTSPKIQINVVLLGSMWSCLDQWGSPHGTLDPDPKRIGDQILRPLCLHTASIWIWAACCAVWQCSAWDPIYHCMSACRVELMQDHVEFGWGIQIQWVQFQCPCGELQCGLAWNHLLFLWHSYTDSTVYSWFMASTITHKSTPTFLKHDLSLSILKQNKIQFMMKHWLKII